jgi:toluene monooxygenase electron transfer component
MTPVADALPQSPVATVHIAGGASYSCAAGDTVLRAGLRAGLGLPYECNAGGCGSCKFELVSGAVDDLWPEAPGIRPKERERGRRLACQSIPRGNCEIKLRTADSYVPAITPQRFVAHFVGRRVVTSDIHEFDFLATGAANFLPGQYALLRIADAGQDRAYSMSNQPNAQGLWRFMVRRVPQGKVSNALFDLKEGAEVGLDGPYGIAHLRSSVQRDIVCIAGGSGLAPMVSIINGALAQPALGGREAWLFYGGRGPADIPRIGEFIHPHPRVRFHPAISVPELAEGTDWAGEVGMVHEMLPRKLPRVLAQYEYYLAGPPPMIEAVVRTLQVDHGVSADAIHYDRFF